MSKFKFLLPIGLLLVVAIATFYLASQIQKELIATEVSAEGIVRGASGDLWADVVIGQPDFTEGAIKERVSNKVNNPGGVVVDRTKKPNRVYISDGGNSRILGYSALGTCSNGSSCTANSDCTTGVCTLTPRREADIVIGQPDFSRSACNGDTGFQFYPLPPRPNASTICTMPVHQISPLEGGAFINFDTDDTGNLYYPDMYNNRVVMYQDPIATDQKADFVWGQSNMFLGSCNKGGPPSETSLCFGYISAPTPIFVVGLDFHQGNLWVADTNNHRVLRFPFDSVTGRPSESANLVLGQPNFTTNSPGPGFNQLKYPSAVKVLGNGDVLVVDSGNNRIMRYTSTLVNGMNGTFFGHGFNYPVSIEPVTNGIWVSNANNKMIELWNRTGTQVLKVISKDIWTPNPPSGSCNSPVGVCALDDSRGSIGITSDGDVLLTTSGYQQDMVRFKAPIPTPVPGVIPPADFRLFNPPDKHNLLSGRSFASTMGVAVANNQLIVADSEARLLFWNNPTSVTNWQMADGVVGASDFTSQNPNFYGRIKADESGHLYVAHKDVIEIFSLPLTSGASPIKTLQGQFIDLEGNMVNLIENGDLNTGGLYPSPDGSELWIANNHGHRVVRVRNPLTFYPQIDVVLGQTDATSDLCNQGNAQKSTSTMCYPGAVALDNFGNVFVADNALEVEGNGRMLIFNSSTVPSGNAQTLYGIPASSVILDGKHTWEPAFDSQNRMVVGYNPYNYSNTNHSLDYFNDVFASNTPSGSFEDFFVMPYAMDFDENDNLYVLDHNRWSVDIFYNPFNNEAITPTPTPSLTPTPTLPTTPTPSPNPTIADLINPSFEIDANGDLLPDNWNFDAAQENNDGITTSFVHSGTNALIIKTSLSPSGPESVWQHISFNPPIPAGTTIFYSGWLANENNSTRGKVAIDVTVEDSGGDTKLYTLSIPPQTVPLWTKVTGTLNVRTPVTGIRFSPSMPEGTGIGYFDDLYFSTTSPDPN